MLIARVRTSAQGWPRSTSRRSTASTRPLRACSCIDTPSVGVWYAIHPLPARLRPGKAVAAPRTEETLARRAWRRLTGTGTDAREELRRTLGATLQEAGQAEALCEHVHLLVQFEAPVEERPRVVGIAHGGARLAIGRDGGGTGGLGSGPGVRPWREATEQISAPGLVHQIRAPPRQPWRLAESFPCPCHDRLEGQDLIQHTLVNLHHNHCARGPGNGRPAHAPT